MIRDSSDLRFTHAECESILGVIAARRDVRHFVKERPMDEAVLGILFQAAHHAPSVGLMQPWRFVRVRDAAIRESIALLVEAERQATALAMGDRHDEFLRLKVEGVRECSELVVAALAPDDGTVFGRRTLPYEMALCSLGCAIQNLWLAARAHNIGLGWVSMFEPAALARLLQMPPDVRPMAVLCLGTVERFYSKPMLEAEGWRQARELSEMVFDDLWGALPDAAESIPVVAPTTFVRNTPPVKEPGSSASGPPTSPDSRG